MIIADWKAGTFKTYYSIAKYYGISDTTARKILLGITAENAHVVEAGLTFESAKKTVVTAVELNAVENRIKNTIKVEQAVHLVIGGVTGYLEGGKAQKVITANMGDGVVEANVVEYDLQAEHYEKAMNAIDKAAITLGVAERHAPKAVQAVQVNSGDKSEYVATVDVMAEMSRALPD